MRLEQAAKDRQPVGFEVGFGLEDLHGEPLARPDPVTIDLGEGMRFSLRGRIDRIDRVGSAVEVVDYKTGRGLTDRRGAVYDRGRLLQHALYALVAEQLAGEPGAVRASSYYFPTVEAQRDWLPFHFPDRERLRSVLDDVLDPLATGAFVHAHEPDRDCLYCDFKAACRAHAETGAAAKLKNESNALLESRRRLLEVE
ncbi:MAG: PD-(D/E)XK nuclease family protein [Armatimonadetes bacterium]|nr:PD-(D/E)XK nuclease family protein [Armatimonadota bacterium]